MDIVGFVLITVFDLVGALIIAMSVFHPKLDDFPKVFKFALVFAMLGLVGQAGRNIMFMLTGVSPTDSDLPIWAFKDIGIGLFSFSWLWYKIKE